jgi:hypothetical protein
MNGSRFKIIGNWMGALLACLSSSASAQIQQDPRNFVGWATDGPAVFRVYNQGVEVLPGPPFSYRPPSEDLPPEVRGAFMTFRVAKNVTLVTNTVRQFDHYMPDSLNNLVWTNFLAHTNNKSMAIWSVRKRPSDWPARPAAVRWNTSSLIWGMRGLTAICPCWQWEGPPGWTPITAFTRRHGYARGHDMGPDGFSKNLAGQKVWFVAQNNSVVEVKILRQVTRTRDISQRDYTMFLFDSDLPASIDAMRVVRSSDIFALPTCKYRYVVGAPSLLFKTEQLGNVSADVPGFTVDTMKGGDSGSPNMLPLPGELAFFNGRTTAGASPEMQADMDQLCRLEGLAPSKYQLQYVDLSSFPTY